MASLALDATVYAQGRRRRKRGRRSGRVPHRARQRRPRLGPILATALRETLGLPRVARSTTSQGSRPASTGIDGLVGRRRHHRFRDRAQRQFHRPHHRLLRFRRTAAVQSVAPYDDYGHGTHIAGLIGSSGMLSNYEFQGIAPTCASIGLKVLDGTGQGKTSDVIRALEFVIANRDELERPDRQPVARPSDLRAGGERSAGPGGAAGSGRRAHRHHVGRKFGVSERTGLPGYAGVTSPCNAPRRFASAPRKRMNTVTRSDDVDRAVQLARAVVVRRLRQAGCRRARTQARVGYEHVVVSLHDADRRASGRSKNGQPLLVAERHEHGGGRGKRRGGARRRRAQSERLAASRRR